MFQEGQNASHYRPKNYKWNTMCWNALYTIYPIVMRALGLAAFRPSARASKGILHTRERAVFCCIKYTLLSRALGLAAECARDQRSLAYKAFWPSWNTSPVPEGPIGSSGIRGLFYKGQLALLEHVVCSIRANWPFWNTRSVL